ncbi:MAG: alpha/beta fold hydrolase [Firmicutes bacterium]|nr:alpha/beta fold hydrolase [Bacillota bacterium]
MVAGSGPTDRDWNSPLLPGSNGSGRLIAEALATRGFASLRYDKRVAGPHARENLPHLLGRVSMASHREEFAGAVAAAVSRSYIRRDRVFGLGHSEGALHVLNYVLNDPQVPLRGIILLAPPGRPVGAVARAQLARQAAALPDGEHLLALYDEAVDRFLAGYPANPDPSLPDGVRQLLSSLEAPANLPFARELWSADAAVLLRSVRLPVLIMIGQKDIQVDWEEDGQRLAQAFGDGANATLAFPPNANHVFKHERRSRTELTAADAARGYNVADTTLDAESVRILMDWLVQHASPPISGATG